MAAGAKIASESISNIRTVASLSMEMDQFAKYVKIIKINCFDFLGQEKYMIARFKMEMSNVQRLSQKKIVFRGLVNSFSQAVPLLAYAVALGYGGYMVANKEIEYKEIVR